MFEPSNGNRALHPSARKEADRERQLVRNGAVPLIDLSVTLRTCKPAPQHLSQVARSANLPVHFTTSGALDLGGSVNTPARLENGAVRHQKHAKEQNPSEDERLCHTVARSLLRFGHKVIASHCRWEEIKEKATT